MSYHIIEKHKKDGKTFVTARIYEGDIGNKQVFNVDGTISDVQGYVQTSVLETKTFECNANDTCETMAGVITSYMTSAYPEHDLIEEQA